MADNEVGTWAGLAALFAAIWGGVTRLIDLQVQRSDRREQRRDAVESTGWEEYRKEQAAREKAQEEADEWREKALAERGERLKLEAKLYALENERKEKP